MRRRAMRRGPGLVGTMARTAVVAGTATATVGAVQGHQRRKAESQQQEAYADQAALQAQQDLEDMKAQMAQMQAQQVQAAAAPPPVAAAPPVAGSTEDSLAKLQKLNDLKQAGALSEDEFQTAKAKIIASL